MIEELRQMKADVDRIRLDLERLESRIGSKRCDLRTEFTNRTVSLRRELITRSNETAIDAQNKRQDLAERLADEIATHRRDAAAHTDAVDTKADAAIHKLSDHFHGEIAALAERVDDLNHAR